MFPLSPDVLVTVLLSVMNTGSDISHNHTLWLVLKKETNQEHGVNMGPVPSKPFVLPQPSLELLGGLNKKGEERTEKLFGDPSTPSYISWETPANLLAHSEPLVLHLRTVYNNIYFLTRFQWRWEIRKVKTSRRSIKRRHFPWPKGKELQCLKGPDEKSQWLVSENLLSSFHSTHPPTEDFW